MKTLMNVLGGLPILALLLLVALGYWLYTRKPAQVYVGTGCEGPSPVAVATLPRYLPGCERVDLHSLQ